MLSQYLTMSIRSAGNNHLIQHLSYQQLLLANGFVGTYLLISVMHLIFSLIVMNELRSVILDPT